MDVTAAPSNFFLAVLTFVPVLWITTGFASEAVRRLVVRVRDARLTVRMSPPNILLRSGRNITYIIEPERVLIRYRKFLVAGPPIELVILEAPGENLGSAAIARGGIQAYVVSGLIAEIGSLVGLCFDVDLEWLVLTVFVMALITLFMTAGAVLTALAAVTTDVFAGRDLPPGQTSR